MYRNEFLMIVWEKEEDKRNIDLLPSRMITCPVIGITEKATHNFVCDEGKGFKFNKAEYDSTSMGNTVVVNYVNDFNKKAKVIRGKMKLIFDSVSKDSLLEVHWQKDGEKSFKKCSVNAKWVKLTDATSAAQKSALNDIVEWLAWK